MTASRTDPNERVTRDAILMLLSDDETASVSTAETAPRLKEKDEHLDLDKLELGVQRATWRWILAALPEAVPARPLA